ncbi:MAG: oligosaccharide flippase family protein, partial [Anaerolineales bacterium]|nr:oligosaccharide flippase family protein [Anaerolineales bacterium]
AYERMALLLGLTVTTAVLQLGGAVALFWLGGGFLPLMGVLLIVQVVTAVLGWLVCRHWLPDFTINWQLVNLPLIKQLLQTGVWLALLMVTAVLSQRWGIFMLSYMGSEAQTGWFAAAYRLVEAARLLPAAVMGALFPVLAQAARGATERPLVWARWGLLGYALLAALLLTWLAPWLVGLLFGADYEPAVGVLRVLAWGIVPYVFHLRYSVELVVRGREKAVLVVTAVALGVTAVVASWGFTEMGLLGLAAVLVVGEGVLAVGLRVIKFYA